MIVANAIPSPKNPVCHQAESHADFIPLIAIVDRHARIVFRHLSAADREEAATEAVAAAFKAFVRLKARGRNPVRDFATKMAAYAVLHTKSGRRVGNPTCTNDVLSPIAQRKHGFRVESLSSVPDRPLHERDHGPDRRPADVIEEQLQDNTRTRPDEQAAFRIDFRDWLAGWCSRDRQIIRGLALGERTADVAAKFSISAGRVSQMRRRFQNDWERYYDASPVNTADVVVA